ncbi:peptidase inhibitor family I36 protein [Streptomyces sp. NPDC006649]|uniref:peptidase inhibitor family I36 protein n=1 Tax=unclassified Streptomyces TaxID=2593676 RepID=UPI003251B952
MKIRNQALAVTAALAAAAFALGSANASAAPHDTPQQARLAQQMHRALALNPGSHQLNSHAIELDKGGVMDLTLADGNCTSGRLCVYKDRNFSGGGTYWSTCTTQDLRNYRWPDGTPVAGNISSIDNRNQYGGVQSRFYDSSNRFMIAVNSGHYLRDLAFDTSATGGNPNDRIYKMKVC